MKNKRPYTKSTINPIWLYLASGVTLLLAKAIEEEQPELQILLLILGVFLFLAALRAYFKSR